MSDIDLNGFFSLEGKVALVTGGEMIQHRFYIHLKGMHETDN